MDTSIVRLGLQITIFIFVIVGLCLTGITITDLYGDPRTSFTFFSGFFTLAFNTIPYIFHTIGISDFLIENSLYEQVSFGVHVLSIAFFIASGACMTSYVARDVCFAYISRDEEWTLIYSDQGSCDLVQANMTIIWLSSGLFMALLVCDFHEFQLFHSILKLSDPEQLTRSDYMPVNEAPFNVVCGTSASASEDATAILELQDS